MATNNASKKTSRGAEASGTNSMSSASDIDWYKRGILSRIYQTLAIHRRKPLPPSKSGRHVPLWASRDEPLIDERRGHAYLSNNIRSSRYTIWDFLPKQFIFQATRLSNFYFICIGIPQAIPGFSTTGNYTTILPLSFFLILTIVKEGYDDYRRHRLDRVENNALAIVLRRNEKQTGSLLSQRLVARTVQWIHRLGKSLREAHSSIRSNVHHIGDLDQDDEHHWTTVKWQDVKVGDILKLQRDEAVPADIVLLHATGENGVAYVETVALDGETNLKPKQALPALQHCCDIQGIKSCLAEFVLEDPNRDLYDFKGSVFVGGSTIPLTINEVLLRGSILRNTSSAIGIVVNTGEECKIRMNANHHPDAKKPRLERYTNQVVLTLIAYVILLSVGCSIGYLLWHSNYEIHAEYLHHAYVPFKEIIVGYLIMFNNVIPLALYVSLEIVKIGQMLMIVGDLGMYDAVSNTPMVCNTNTILENLGQVSYVLSDKTGTLTENVMKFRGLSVVGTAWLHQTDRKSTQSLDARDSKSFNSNIGPETKDASSNPEKLIHIVVHETEVAPAVLAGRASIPPSALNHSPRISHDEHRPSGAQLYTTDLLKYISQHRESLFSRKVFDFILALALCHTAIPEVQHDGSIGFQASSPDELALVRGAQELGVLVCNRSSHSITLLSSSEDQTKKQEVYQILDIIEFSSKRKRMSIIVRRPDGQIWLLSKGADSALIPRLSQASLAARKSHEVRNSLQIERDIARKSGQYQPRNSFGGRPSMTIRRLSSMDFRHSMEIRLAPKGSKTLEVAGPYQGRSLRPSFDRRRSKDSQLYHIEDLSNLDDGLVFTRCFEHLNEFATQGLRTLLFAGKILPESDYLEWSNLYSNATTSLDNRQERVEEAAEIIEQGLDLLGASAIEDKLQKGVPETIDKLRRANIKIWMLTGDKRETAINIAHAARICQPTSNIFTLDTARGEIERQLRDLAADIQNDGFHTVVVIDGQTLAKVERDSTLVTSFYSLTTKVDSVICCRASPAQKASIVQVIRAQQSGLVMAIGDGANDIAMITSSHVGVGISGKEGLQAARVADYSISQFRFLQRLLLVHGRWNYVRTSKFILWTYWKEMFFYMAQALYQHTNGYTGSSLYENWSLTMLNTLFTSLCVIVPGIFEQDLRADTLLAVPELYVYGQRNRGLNLPRYIRWMVLAVAEGVLIWVLPRALYGIGDVTGDNGTFAIGDLCFSLAIMWTNTKLLLIETHHKSTPVLVSFAITTGGWWLWNTFLSFAYAAQPSPFSVRGGFIHTFGPNLTWWAVLVLSWGILVVFEVVQKQLRQFLLHAGLWPPSLSLLGWSRMSAARSRRTGRTAEALGVEVWQELEQDPETHERLKHLAYNDDDDDVEAENHI